MSAFVPCLEGCVRALCTPDCTPVPQRAAPRRPQPAEALLAAVVRLPRSPAGGTGDSAEGQQQVGCGAGMDEQTCLVLTFVAVAILGIDGVYPCVMVNIGKQRSPCNENKCYLQ